MTKKVLDISPPRKSVTSIPEKRFEKKPRFYFFKRIIGIFVVLGVVFGVVVGLSFRSTLTLKVHLLTEPIEFQEEIEVNVSQEKVDFQQKIIPGRFFAEEKEKWKTFYSTGKDFEEGKAHGVIRVYNAHTPPAPITLRAQTRFLSSQAGKIFRSTKKIYIPKAQIKNGKVIPGSVEIEVVAQEPGEDYNIGPSKFSIPGLAGTAYYYTIWAESESEMEGGFKKEVKKVTSKDLENAKAALEKSLEKIAKDSLQSKIPKDFVLNDKAITQEDFQVSCFQKPGDKVPEFNCQGKIKLKGLAFKFSDLKELARQFVFQKIPFSKKLQPESLNLNFSPKTLLFDQGKMILSLTITAKIYETFNKEIFLSQIKGKSQKEIERIVIENYSQIENVEFKFWPFWLKIAPKNVERIKLEFKFRKEG
jgi:hypothetical protein